MLKKIALGILMFLADVVVSAIIKAVSGSTAPKKLIDGLVNKVAESNDPPEVKLQHVTKLIDEAKSDFRDDLHKLPNSLKNLVIEMAVTKAKSRVGALGSE